MHDATVPRARSSRQFARGGAPRSAAVIPTRPSELRIARVDRDDELAAACLRAPSRPKRIVSVVLGAAVSARAWPWVTAGALTDQGLLLIGGALVAGVVAVLVGVLARVRAQP